MSNIASNLSALREIAKTHLAAKSSHAWKEPGNKFDHGIRTAQLAERLRLAICPDDRTVQPEILTAAAWFHDLCNGQDNHEQAAADQLPFLIGHLCTSEELQTICAMIRVHDTRIDHTKQANIPYTPTIQLLQDADMLDHLGSYDIWITFAEFSYQHRTPRDYTACFHDGSFDRFAEKWRKHINYPFSRTIFDEKIAFEKAFAARMERELNGEFC